MNDLMRLKLERRLSYGALADAIEQQTCRRYSPAYLSNVARGEVALADGLRLHLFDTFRDYRLLPSAQLSANIHYQV